MTKILFNLAAASLAAVLVSAQAAVSLDVAISPDKNTNPIGQIQGMAALPDGRLAVLSDDHLLLIAGETISKLALAGKGKSFEHGKFEGISLSGQDLMLSHISDGYVARINLEGKKQAHIGIEGDALGELSDPRGLAWTPSRRVYVADSDNSRVSVFGEDGVFLYALGSNLPEKQRMRTPLQVAVDALERVYVLERAERGAVLVFDVAGNVLKRLDAAALQKITGSNGRYTAMTVDANGLLYLADSDNGRIVRIDWEKGVQRDAFGSKGEGRGQFAAIAALSLLADGRLAVADTQNRKIEIYRLDAVENIAVDSVRLPTVLQADAVPAKCERALTLVNDTVLCLEKKRLSLLNAKGEQIKLIGDKFSALTTAASDSKNFLVVDDDFIKLYTLEGEAQFQGKGLAGSGSAVGKLDTAQGAFIRGDKIYIADTDNARVQIFTRDGIYLDQIANPKKPEKPLFAEPAAIAVDTQGNIFVADVELQQVLAFSPERKLLYKLGGEAEVNKRPFTRVYDIGMDGDNNLYVLCETPGNRYGVQVYRGLKKEISFAAYSDAPGGLSEAVNLSVAQSSKTIIGVYDIDRKKLLNFSYAQVPQRVGGVLVNGSVAETRLSWPPVPGSYIAGYNIYSGDSAEAEMTLLQKSESNEVAIKHADKPAAAFYKVSAVSGLGAEGKTSRAEQDLFHAALVLFNEKQFQKAADIFSQVLTDHPQHADALHYLGQSQLELKQVDAAVQSFTALSNLPGYESKGSNLLLRGLFASGEYVAARAVVDDLIAKKHADTQAYIFCGEISLKLNDGIGAVTCLEEAQDRDPKNVRSYLLMGEAYIVLGMLEKGLAEFDKAAEMAPDNAEIGYRAGVVMQGLKRHQEAVEKFNKALAINPAYSAARLELAKSYVALNQLDQVRNMAITLAGQADTAGQGQYLLGLVALTENKNGEALLALAKATRLDTKNADAWLALADTYERLGQKEVVRNTLVSATTADKQSFAAFYRLGKMDYNDKKYADAATALAVAVSVRGADYEVRYFYASALYEAGKLAQAGEAAQEAAKLKPDEIAPLVLLAHIANREGKTARAIDVMKQVMDKQPNSSRLHAELGGLYTDNNLFDQAQPMLEKAAILDAASALPQVLLGNLFMKRRLFDKAIPAYEKAIKLQPGQENRVLLDNAYAEQKKALDFKSNAPQIVLKNLRFEQVFSAAYKQYASKPVARVQIQNTSGTDYGNLKLTFSVQGYMDFPATKELQLLAANTDQEIELTAAFNNRILEIDEDTGVQAEVAVHYVRDGREDAIRLTQPMTIYGKNAILWGTPHMVGSFVTPKDDTLRDFVRQAINQNKPEAGTLNANLVSAMTLFDVFTTQGMRYVVDPNSPYSKVSSDRVDYVQFARETLRLKSGDCDDLSVLLAASLENLGVETAIVDVPGHLMMMFNTGLDENQRDRISLEEDLLVIRDKQIWIPLEATMIGTSFIEAWAEGARKYNEFAKAGKLKVVAMKSAWNEYVPVTLKPANYSIELPAKERVASLLNRERNVLLQKSLDRLVKPYETMAAMDSSNVQALMQVSIIYAKYGLYDAAEKNFEKILKLQPQNGAVHNNRGNIFYSQTEYERAIEAYEYAEQLAASDAGIKVNIAMASYQLGRLDAARTKFDEAVAINPEVSRQFAGLAKLLSR